MSSDPSQLDVASPPAAAGADGGDRVLVRALTAVLFASVFLQRFGIPVGATSYVSPVLLLVLGVCAWLLVSGRLVEDRGRLAFLVVAGGACLAVTLVHGLGSEVISVTSLALLVVSYSPFALRWSTSLAGPDVLPRLLAAFVKMMTVVAGAAVLEVGSQLVGLWQYDDLMARVVPQQLLVQGYNYSILTSYGAAVYKANGVVMLEPSFCSQFVALAILAVLATRPARRTALLVLFGLALLSTVSGTGLLLLLAGLVAEALHRGRRFTLYAVGGGSLVVAVVLATPLGAIYTGRAAELSRPSSSGSQRFVAPYTGVVADLRGSDETLLLGNGPGSADRNAARIGALTGAPLIAPPAVKLVYEYGVPAGLAFVGFIGYALWARSPSANLSLVLLVYFFVLSGGLLQTQTLYVAWVFGCVLAVPARMSARRGGSARHLPPPAPASWATQPPVPAPTWELA